MNPNAYKELTPVVYGKKLVKCLPTACVSPRETCFNPHWHERIELLLIRDGELIVQLAGEQRKVHAGQLIIINSCQLHTGWTEKQPASYDVVMFDLTHFFNPAAAVHQYLLPLIEHKAAFIPMTEDKDIWEAAETLITHQNEGTYHPLCTAGEAYRLLGLLLERCLATEQTINKADEKISTVVSYITEHFSENISTASLSRQFNYSEAYFCRLFKRATGLTVSEYIRILRLEQAQKQLKDTRKNIAVIATQCGFADAGYFANCFTKQFGITPSAFRQQNR